jgi:hypothetical protein
MQAEWPCRGMVGEVVAKVVPARCQFCVVGGVMRCCGEQASLGAGAVSRESRQHEARVVLLRTRDSTFRCRPAAPGCAHTPMHSKPTRPTPAHLDRQVEASQLVSAERVCAAAHDYGTWLVQLHDLVMGESRNGGWVLNHIHGCVCACNTECVQHHECPSLLQPGCFRAAA